MKTYLCYSVVAFFLASFKAAGDDQTRKWGEVTNQVKMSISLNTQDTKVAANKPVVLRIVFKNLSTNEAFAVYNSIRQESDDAFSFVVTTPLGTIKIDIDRTIAFGSHNPDTARRDLATRI